MDKVEKLINDVIKAAGIETPTLAQYKAVEKIIRDREEFIDNLFLIFMVIATTVPVVILWLNGRIS